MKLKALGKTVKAPKKPSWKILEFIQLDEEIDMAGYECLEVTSLCPITGQPDYGKIDIVLHNTCAAIESKSLKLYLGTFRNQGIFGEKLCLRIANDLQKGLGKTSSRLPHITVAGEFNSRGGIKIKPHVSRCTIR